MSMKMQNMKKYGFVVGASLACGVLPLAVNGLSTSAISQTVNAYVTVTDACNMTSSGGNHTAEIGNGTYQADIGSTTLKITCNDASGFAVYAVGFTGDTIGGTNSTKLVGSGTGLTIDTGTATGSNANDASNWAMKVGTITSPTPSYPITILSDTGGSFGSYHTVPASYTKVASRTSSTDIGIGAEGSTLTATYAAFINSGQAADTYVGKVKYTLVHPANEVPMQPQMTAAGKICYYASTVMAEGTMGCQTVTSSATTAKLFASNFNRAGYGFAGWSDAYDYETNANAHFYGPNETISFTAGQYTGSNAGLSLYAVWVKSAGYFQDYEKSESLCSYSGSLVTAPTDGTANLSSVSALTDRRDNQTYAIARLADGNCWMIENLRLDNTAELTYANTNEPLNDGTNVTLKHNYTDTQTYNTLSATSSVAYNADTAPDGWCTANSAACDDQSRLRTDNTANRVTYTSGQTMSTDANLYSYGNYYNWYSATAGNGTYDFDVNNTSTDGDLCPHGWRLPKGGDKTRIESGNRNEIWYFIVNILNNGTMPANYASTTIPYYNGSTEAGPVDALIRTWPNNFVHSGYVNGAWLYDRGSRGRYWSSTASSAYGAYSLYFYSTYVGPGTNDDGKHYGRTIRCMADPGHFNPSL